jgi:succinate dehydrogenase/fumarate reductase cytochrome b subunit
MTALVAFYFGWVMGARGGQKSLDEVSAAMTSLRESEEFTALLFALRAHLGYTLHQAADWLQAVDGPPPGVPDVLARIQDLVFSTDTGSAAA